MCGHLMQPQEKVVMQRVSDSVPSISLMARILKLPLWSQPSPPSNSPTFQTSTILALAAPRKRHLVNPETRTCAFSAALPQDVMFQDRTSNLQATECGSGILQRRPGIRAAMTNTTNLVASNYRNVLTVLEARGPKSRCQQLQRQA